MMVGATHATALLRAAAVAFWDFDGVIKDTVTVKGVAFERLFLPYGRDVAARVRRHHEDHGGVSRFEKMPLYLEWAGEPGTAVQGADVLRSFRSGGSSSRDRRAMGAGRARVPRGIAPAAAIRAGQRDAATGDGQILAAAGIDHCFREVHGAPGTKLTAVRDVLDRWRCAPGHALVVGDAETDFEAATANGVPFLLRRTELNGLLQAQYSGPSFEHLDHD